MIRRAALALALVAAAAVVLLVVAGGPGDLIRRAVGAGMEAAGLPVRSLGPVSLGRRGLLLRDLAIGRPGTPAPDLEVRVLRLEVSPRGLLRRDLGRLSAEGLRLRGRVDTSGIHFGALDPFLSGGDEGGGTSPAFALAGRVEEGEILLETPAEPLVVRFRSDFRRGRRGGLGIRVEFSAEHAFGTAAGWAEADLDPGGALAADALLRGPGGAVARFGVRRGTRGEAGPAGGDSGGRASPEDVASAWIRYDGGTVPDAIAGAAGLAELRLGPGWLHLRTEGPLGGTTRVSAAGVFLLSRVRGGAGSALRGVTLGLAGSTAPGPGPGPAGGATVRIGAVTDEAVAGDLRIRGLRSEAHLAVAAPEGDAPGLELHLVEPARLSAEALQLAGGARTARPLSLRVRRGAGPLLHLEREPEGAIRWSTRWRTDAAEIEVDPGGALAGSTGALRGKLPAFEVELVGRPGGGLPRGRVRGSQGRLTARAAAVRVDAIGVDVELPEAGDTVRASLSAGPLRDLRRPARFGPVSAGFHVRLDARDLDRATFTARVEGRGHPLRIEVRGEHRLRTGRGAATLALGPVRFEEGGPGPAAILPAIAPFVDRARGEVEGRAELRWPLAPGPAGTGEVAVADLDLAGPAGELEGLGGRVVLTSLLPPATPPGQEIRATAGMAGGLRLEAPRLRFQLRRDRRLVLEAFRAGLAGGTLSTSGTVDLASDDPRLVLNVQGVDLARLLQELGTGAVELSGTVIGALPLVLRDGALRIEGGELYALPPGGILRYRVGPGIGPVTGPASGTDLARAALENLHYETLRITVDGALAGELRIRLEVLGRNPDVYGGAAFKVGLNLSGRFLDLIHAGTTGYRLQHRLERRLDAR